MRTDRWQMKFAYTFLIAYTYHVAREFHYLNRSVYSANRWASHKMCQHQQLQLLLRADCKLFSIVDTVQTDRELTSFVAQDFPILLQQHSGATGSEPMQINNDQSRIEIGEPAAGGNAKIDFAVSQTI